MFFTSIPDIYLLYLNKNDAQPVWEENDSLHILSLTIANPWSGCTIQNLQGQPNYQCSGGKVIKTAQTITIIMRLCHGIQPSSVYLNYSLDLYGQMVNGNDCFYKDVASARIVVPSKILCLLFWFVIFCL